MINKTVKKVILIAGGLYITYLVGVAILAESIPYPTSQQLKEAEKVVERYIGENNGVKLINTSSSFTAEMFDRSIHIEGNSKENPEQVFRMDLDRVSNENERITEKLINNICKSNDGGKNFTCVDAE
ncbi:MULTISPECIES: hypothetical protein [Bacillus]|uniref:Uncharacterized protein n=2 Tax=Bacillus cereus group TaxID=86661 RepID=A0A2B0Y738_BACAN|nr:MULTISPECIES: hypothetical protein [Bacillus]MCU0095923.1 hypothetical protein [Bacillus sp. OR9]KZD39081.1 hypothetical protein B4082_1426 [Bacillus cereus]MBJ8060465.1 hypothetical protein [Bacillus cereus]MCU4758103.1 hypothetical protein [Bacillus cereus]MCU5107425.1 hypothetical protein [Bacillus cereus]